MVPASQTRLEGALVQAIRRALVVKADAAELRDLSAAGDIPRQAPIALMAELSRAIDEWQSLVIKPGIGAYAQEQYGDPALDIVAEFNAAVLEATSLRDWIHSVFPRDAGDGAWRVHTYDLYGQAQPLTFTSAQMAEFRTRANALIATIG